RPLRVIAGPLAVILWLVPIGAPFPNVAANVEQAVSVGRIRGHGRGSTITVALTVADRKPALPDVRLPLAPGFQFVAPAVRLPIDFPTGRKFPLGLSRQALAGPIAVGFGVVPGDVYRRMVFAPLEVAVGAIGMSPVRAGHVPPPGQVIIEPH